VLLSNPVALDINELAPPARAAFLRDMVIAGDALLEVTGARLINYMVLGNYDRALHAHIHPRYADEPPDTRQQGPWAYHGQDVPFDVQRDRDLMQRIGNALDRRTAGA
jgi:diadenosine tetraphosphate (Ap4A) HIT family hydrolase